MKVIFLLPILLIGFVPFAFADYRGGDYLDVDNGDGTHTWTGGLSPWVDTGIIENGKKKFVHYMIDDQPTYVKVQNGEASFVFDKTTCSAKIYDGGLISDSNDFILGSDSYVPKSSVDGSGIWSIVNSVNNVSCVTEIIETENSIAVSGTRQSSAGIFKITYLKEDGKKLKTILEATNLTSLTDRRFGVTQTQSIPQIIIWAGEQRNLANYVGQTFDRQWLENNKANLSNLFIYDNLQFDVIDAWNNLESISVNSVSNGMASISFNYLRNAPILLPNETLIIDPTYSSNNPTVDGDMADSNNDNICNGAGLTKATGGSAVEIGPDATTDGNDCKRAFFEWDISSIPTDAVISNTVFKFESISPVGTPYDCVFVSMSSQPSVASDAAIWAAIGGGTTLATDTTCKSAGTNRSVDLGANGDSYIQSQLASGWAAIGAKGATETLDASYHLARIDTEEAVATPDPTLEITYATTPPPDAVTDLTTTSIGYTNINIDWTPPDSGSPSQSIIGYQINVTTPQTNNPLVYVNDTGITDSNYNIINLLADTDYSIRVSAWTNVTDGHPLNNATGNVVNATTIPPTSADTVNETISVVGDTARLIGFVNVTSGGTSANLTSIKIILNGTTIETNSTIQNSTGTPYGVNIGPFWIRMPTANVYEFEVETTLQNTVESVINSTSFFDSREYNPDYSPAIDSPTTQGDVNATVTRFDNQDGLLLKVNRLGVSTGDTWQIECIAQTNSEAAQTKNETQSWQGDWQNETNTGYFNTTFTGFLNSHAYITCFNEDKLFTLTDFTDSSLALLGIQLFDDSYGSMIGVPVGIFFLVMTAGMANKRTAPTFIILITGVAGTMATIGFFTFEPLVWGLALVTAMLGIFVNQKIF